MESIWNRYSELKPPLGQDVIAYHRDWVDADCNPNGIRIGWQGDDDFISAHWWNYQDCYMTISHSECDDNPTFSEKIKNSIEPELWVYLPHLTDYSL